MATTLYLWNDSVFGGHRGTNDPKVDGTTNGWECHVMRTTRGDGVASDNCTTVTGPTNGIEIIPGANQTVEWISPPLSAGITISGTISFNLWGLESNMNANASFQVILERIDNTGAIVASSIFSNTQDNAEINTSNGVNTWSDTAPTSTAFNKGDRIRARVLANDAPTLTMGNGFTVTLNFNGTTSGASGDSFISFTENLSVYETDPSGAILYLTDTASDIADQGAGNDEKEMWTSRGGSATTAVRDTTAGWTSPLQWTKTAGGNTIEWYSKRVNAFTLSGLVRANLRMLTSALNTCGANVELAVVNNDGTGANVYGASGSARQLNGSLANAETVETFYISGPDISVSDGQRLRLRARIDDWAFAAVTARTATIDYNGPTLNANGDSWIQLTETVTEFTAGGNTYTKAGYGKEHG